MRRTVDLSAYLVLDPDLCAGIGMAETAGLAARAGVGVVQLRHKTATTAERIGLGREIRAALQGTGALLIVNDDAAAAVALEADGLHVGQGDLSPVKARSAIGPDRILGLSVECEAHARAVNPSVVDYVGISPVFATGTKPDHAPPVGIDGLRRLAAICPVPAVAIGGIGANHARDVLGAGAAGLAVVSAICGQPDPAEAARRLVAAIREARS